LNALGQLLDFLCLLDHVQGKDIGAGLIHVLLEFGGESHQFLGVKPQLGLPVCDGASDQFLLE
jgi:hypothetical protein